ncbi:MAG: hypothetical protein KDK64_03440 [Chlamydiia bacterium]|nr:hypothetical protein [Chlamydiia bacterium]
MTAFIGPLTGLGVGTIANAAINRSIWTTREKTLSLGPLETVSRTCEETRMRPTNFKGFVEILIIVEMIPIALAVLENLGITFYKKRSQLTKQLIIQQGCIGAKLLGQSFFNLCTLTVIMATTVLSSKLYFTKRCKSNRLDPSGHAITICINAFLRYQLLLAAHTAQLGSYSHQGLVYFVSAAEGIWGLDTAANYHSSADVVSGVAIAALGIGSFMLLKRGCEILGNKTFSQIQRFQSWIQNIPKQQFEAFKIMRRETGIQL